jgi:hypothetical protein
VTQRFASMSSARRLLLAVALLAGAVAVLIWRLMPDDTVTKVTSKQAQAEFRRLVDGDPSRRKAVEGLPTPGVYRYSVIGSEHLDSLLSATHGYSGITRIVVVSRSCGFEEEWRVLRERWSTAILCPGRGGELRLSQLHEHHEFFGTVNDVLYSCRPLPVAETRCSSASGSVSYSTRRGPTGTVNIAGQRFRAVHLQAHAVFSGESAGSGSIEEWRRASDGLLLRKRVSISAEVASAGGGEYGEHYQLELLTPHPTR